MSERRNNAPGMRERDVTLSTGQTRPRSPAEALEPARAPARPKRRRKKTSGRVSGTLRLLSGILTLSLAVVVGLGAVTLWLYFEFERPGPLTVSRTFGVPRGEGPIEISARLEREGIIANRWAFVASHTLRNMMSRGKPLHLKAGEYEFKKGASMSDVLAVLVEGKSILLKITLPEGLTSAQIVERLKADENLSGDIAEVPPEGSLLPDTYRFSKGMERQELLDRMHAEQQRFLAAVWEKRQNELPIDSPDQALILASIVERETGRADERERVAAVFVNRLRKGMRLQSDPTIISGLVGGQGSLGRSITRADIDSKTPYNTYQIKGLPPTPICNPGRSAIAATLDPAATKDIYFVADGTGGHAFSETLKEHNAAVSNWRKVEQQQKARADANAGEQTPDVPERAPNGAQAEQGPITGGSGARQTPSPSATAASETANSKTVVRLNAGTSAAAAHSTSDEAVPLPSRKPKKSR